MVKALDCGIVVTPVTLLRSLSDKYPWERYEPPHSPIYGLNGTTTVLLKIHPFRRTVVVPCVGAGATPFPGLLHFTLDPYLIMLSVKQRGIKYHFLSLLYDST